MKKFLSATFAFGLALSMSACSDDSSSSSVPETDPVVPGEESGSYSEMGAIDETARALLEKVIEDTDYESAECDSVATQAVSGVNYKFQCSIKDGDETKDIFIVVYKPLSSSDDMEVKMQVLDADGNEITYFEVTVPEVDPVILEEDSVPEVDPVILEEDSVPEVDPVILEEDSVPEVDPVVPGDSTTSCSGCYSEYADLTADDLVVFEKANALSDSTFKDPTAVSKQVVSGTNYKFNCTLEYTAGTENKTEENTESTTEEASQKVEELVILSVYVNLSGEVEITGVESQASKANAIE